LLNYVPTFYPVFFLHTVHCVMDRWADRKPVLMWQSARLLCADAQ